MYNCSIFWSHIFPFIENSDKFRKFKEKMASQHATGNQNKVGFTVCFVIYLYGLIYHIFYASWLLSKVVPQWLSDKFCLLKYVISLFTMVVFASPASVLFHFVAFLLCVMLILIPTVYVFPHLLIIFLLVSVAFRQLHGRLMC